MSFSEKKNISQENFAKLLGFKHHSTISYWESGINEPRVTIVPKLCQILEITPNQLFGFEKCMTTEKEKNFSEFEFEALELLSGLNDLGKDIILDLIEGFLAQDEYKKTSGASGLEKSS